MKVNPRLGLLILGLLLLIVGLTLLSGCCDECDHPIAPDLPQEPKTPENDGWYYPNGHYASSQEDLDALAGVKIINGELMIAHWPDADLSPLSNLEMVKGLHISNQSITDLHSLGNLKSVEYGLFIFNADSLQSLAGLDSLQSCGSIILEWIPHLSSLAPLSRVKNIDYLSIRGLSNVESIDDFENLEKLRGMHVSECPRLMELPSVAMPALNYMSLSDLNVLPEVVCGAGELPILEELTLSNLPALDPHMPWPALPVLSSVSLWYYSSNDDLQFLHGMPSLKVLKIYRSSGVIDFSGLSGLPVESLRLEGLPNSSFEGFYSAPGLHSLTIHDCDELTALTGLAVDAPIDELWITRCNQFMDPGNSPSLSNVDYLRITDCGVEELNLGMFKSLGSLSLQGLHALRGIQLTPLSGLQSISLGSCDSLVDLTWLAAVPELTNLSISGCSQITDLDGPNYSSAMGNIHLSSNPSLDSLDALSGIESVNTLTIRWNHSLGNAVAYAFAQEIEILDRVWIEGNGP